MQRYSAPPGAAWRLGPGPFVFRGPPPLCTGELELINTSDEKVRVRSVPVVLADGKGAKSLPMEEVQVGVRLAPNHGVRAPAHVRVDPRTAPGTYEGEAECGDQRERVIVHVMDRLDIRLEPALVHLRGVGGEKHRFTLVVANLGNLRQTLPARAEVFLEERNWVNRSLVFALRNTGEEEGHEAYLDHLVKELRSSLVRPAHLTIEADPAEIEPGQTREIPMEIALPDGMFKGRTYTGSTPLLSSRLAFRVECIGVPFSTKRRPQ